MKSCCSPRNYLKCQCTKSDLRRRVLLVDYNKCVNRCCSYLKVVIACLVAASSSGVALAQTNLFVGALKQNVVFEFSSFDDIVFTESTFTSLVVPETMVFDPSGNLFVSNGSDKTIKKITPSGAKTTFASGIDVVGMAFDAFGNLFVSQRSKDTDASEGVILEFAPDGSGKVFASNLSKPQGLAFDSLGNLYVADPVHHAILKISPDGRQTRFATGIAHPHRLAFDAFGFLWVTDPGAGALYAIAPAGVVFLIDTSALDPELTGLNDLAFDEAGNLFLTAGNSVVEIDSTLTTLFTVASVPGGAGGIAVEPPLVTNLSTRVFVQGISSAATTKEGVALAPGSGSAIAGFIISGSGPKQVILRGIGPSLSHFQVANVLQDPTLDLHDSSGNLIASNDDWQTAANADQIPTRLQPSDSREPVILATLPPGRFTAILRGKNGASGVGLIEVNEGGNGVASKLTNVSTRGFVGTGENVMIGGFILSGGSGKRMTLIRALGPTLSQSPFNIAGTLTDPILMLVDANGSVIASNDNWKSSQQSEIQVTGLAPRNDSEAAILITLPPGRFTAIVSGKNAETGIALVDAFASP
jgi:sugar lactone lactonase YvrE